MDKTSQQSIVELISGLMTMKIIITCSPALPTHGTRHCVNTDIIIISHTAPALAQGWGLLRTQLGENSHIQVQVTHLVWWHPSHFRWCIESSSTSRATPSGARQTETCFILPRHSEKISDPRLKRIDLLIDLWHAALWACSCSGTNLHRSQTRQTWTPQGSPASRAAPVAPTL